LEIRRRPLNDQIAAKIRRRMELSDRVEREATMNPLARTGLLTPIGHAQGVWIGPGQGIVKRHAANVPVTPEQAEAGVIKWERIGVPTQGGMLGINDPHVLIPVLRGADGKESYPSSAKEAVVRIVKEAMASRQAAAAGPARVPR